MAEGHVPSPLTIKGMRSSMVKIRHPFFLFSFLAILIGWRKRQSIALPFTTVDTLVFMASRCHFKQRMSGYLKARWSLLFVVLCNISPRYATQSLSPLPGCLELCLCFYAALHPRGSMSPGPFPFPDSLTLMLLSCTQHWLFYFLLSATVSWVLSRSLLECLFAMYGLHWGKGGVEHLCLCLFAQEKQSQSRKHPDGNAPGRGSSRALQLQLSKP